MTSAPDEYWFDSSALTRVKGRSVKARLGALRPGGRFTDDEHDALAAFAAANGLDYARSIARGERELPSKVLTSTCEAVVSRSSAPRVEFGNHGWRYSPTDTDKDPDRRGYVAIQHGAALPELFTLPTGPAKKTLLDVAGKVYDVVSFFDPDYRAEPPDRGRALPPPYTEVALPPGPFRVMAATPRHGEAAALVTGALPLLAEVATSFDVESRDGWLIASSRIGEIATLDPATWAWAFSVASRMLDLLTAWDAGTSRAGVAFATADRHPHPGRSGPSVPRLRPRRS